MTGIPVERQLVEKSSINRANFVKTRVLDRVESVNRWMGYIVWENPVAYKWR